MQRHLTHLHIWIKLDNPLLKYLFLDRPYLPVAVLSSSSSSLSDARKGTVARSSSSALMRPTMPSPWILQSIPELRHCLIAISTYLWYCWKHHSSYHNTNFTAVNNDQKLMSTTKQTYLSAVIQQKDSGVCGIDVNCLQLNQVVQRASTCTLLKKMTYDVKKNI